MSERTDKAPIALASSSEASASLARSAGSGDLPGALDALRRGANPDFIGDESCWGIRGEAPRPLHMAFRRGDEAMARALMAAGADLHARCGKSRSMGLWLGMGLERCAESWIEAGGDPWADVGDSLVAVATRGGKPALWRAIAKRWDPSRPSCAAWREADRQVAMQLACKWRNAGALRIMGALGWVPDAWCVRSAAAEMVQWGESKGAERDARALAKTLFALGAPDLDASSEAGVSFSSIWGAAYLREVNTAFAPIAAEERSKIEARLIAAAAKKSRTCRSRALGGRL